MEETQAMTKCSRYCENNNVFGARLTPCQCPKCSGWLAWEEKKGDSIQQICHKCGVELITITCHYITQIGDVLEPDLARPVPFCFHGFLLPPLTSARVFVDDVPARLLANCILTTS